MLVCLLLLYYLFFLLTQRSAYYTTVFMRCPLGLFGQLLLLDPLCPSLEGAAQMSRCSGQMRYRGGTVGTYLNLSKFEQVRSQRIEILCESHERDYCVILKLFAVFFSLLRPSQALVVFRIASDWVTFAFSCNAPTILSLI